MRMPKPVHVHTADAVGHEVAQQWHDNADGRCTTILGRIRQLTDAEADALEPAFTEVENRLSRLRHFFLVPAGS
jgi:hypothetical protein